MLIDLKCTCFSPLHLLPFSLSSQSSSLVSILRVLPGIYLDTLHCFFVSVRSQHLLREAFPTQLIKLGRPMQLPSQYYLPSQLFIGLFLIICVIYPPIVLHLVCLYHQNVRSMRSGIFFTQCLVRLNYNRFTINIHLII